LELCVEIRVSPFSNFPAQTKKSAKISYTTFNNKKSEANNNLVGFSKKKTTKLELNTPRLTLKLSSKFIPPREAEDKKGILLYQQIERNKIFNSGNELVNRFHLKV